MSRRNRQAEPEPNPLPPSKTQRKHEMHALQALGEQLVALDRARLATLALPERLHDAVTLARTITRHEGRRRQMQYIGRLMREIDPAPLAAAFRLWNEGPAQARVRFAGLERWRTRLLDEPGALDEFMVEHPAADRGALARLVADAQAERTRGGPPHRQRGLFRALNRITGSTGDAHDVDPDASDAPVPDDALSPDESSGQGG